MKRVYYYVPKDATSRACTACGIEKPFTEFNKDSRGPLGYKSICKICDRKRQNPNPKTKIIQASLFTKICTKCNIEKSYEDFFPDKTKRDGYHSQCRECRGKQGKVYYRSNKERIGEREKKYYQSHKEQKRISELQRKHRMRWNKPDYRRRTPIFSESYKEHRRIQNKLWIKNHPHFNRDRAARRRALKRKTRAGKVDFKRILERYGYWCYICEQPIDPNAEVRSQGSLTFDHVIPLDPRPGEPQGTHTEENLRPAHYICNCRKKNNKFEDMTPWQRRGIE